MDSTIYSEILVLINFCSAMYLAITSSVTLPELRQNYSLAHMCLPQNRDADKLAVPPPPDQSLPGTINRLPPLWPNGVQNGRHQLRQPDWGTSASGSRPFVNIFRFWLGKTAHKHLIPNDNTYRAV